jgi:hypothetical protein
MNRVSIPGTGEKSLLVQGVHTGSGAYPTPHSLDTRNLSRGAHTGSGAYSTPHSVDIRDLSRGDGGKSVRAWTGYSA